MCAVVILPAHLMQIHGQEVMFTVSMCWLCLSENTTSEHTHMYPGYAAAVELISNIGCMNGRMSASKILLVN